MKINSVPFLVGIVVFILICFSLVFVFSGPSDETGTGSEQNAKGMIIQTAKGNVSVRDFSKNLVRQTANTQTLASVPEYEISYFLADHAFAITIYGTPLQKVRDSAEDKFLEILGIGKGEACKLSVSLTVPYQVDVDHSGKDFGLSFCPKSLQF